MSIEEYLAKEKLEPYISVPEARVTLIPLHAICAYMHAATQPCNSYINAPESPG